MTRFRPIAVATAALGVLLATLGLALLAVPAAPAHAQTTPAATNGTIYVFCLDFGKDFPKGQSIKAQGLADANVRGALNYALGKGYLKSDPYQVQLAMWKLSNGDFHDINNKGTTIAQEIVNNAGTAPSGSATDVGDITITNLQPTDATNAFGTGTVNGTVAANIPVGFLLPASAANFQRLISVVYNPQAAATTAPATAAATTAPATAAATTAPATIAATAAPTTAAAAPTTAPATAEPTAAPTVAAAPATGNGWNNTDGGSPTAAGMLFLLLGVALIFSAGVATLAVARRRAIR